MSSPQISNARPYWPVPLVRAAVALAVGLTVTFLADHSPTVGLYALGALALGTGLVMTLVAKGRVADVTVARLHAGHGIIALLLGAAALAFAFAGGGIVALLLLATVFAVVTGALELYVGVRTRGAGGRDWITVGVGTVILGLVLLLAPGDSVSIVGFIGAYAVLLGVYLVIASLSMKWAPADQTPAAAGTDPHPGAAR